MRSSYPSPSLRENRCRKYKNRDPFSVRKRVSAVREAHAGVGGFALELVERLAWDDTGGKTMRKSVMILGLLFFGLGIVVLVFADGLRRWYSGIFFILIGAVAFANGVARRGEAQE